MDWFTPILDWAGKHISWRWVVAICGVAALFLFLPQPILIRFGLLEFSQKNHALLFIVFLLTFAFLCTYVLSWMQQTVSNEIRQRKSIRNGKTRLHNLSSDEKVILNKFVQAGGSVLNLDIMTGTAIVLREEGLIYAPVIGGRWHIGRMHAGFPYKIQPWVLRYLKHNPECLR